MPVLGKIALLIVIVHFTWSLRDVTRRTQIIYSEPLSKTLIDHVNKLNTTWKAGVNFDKNDDIIISQLTRRNLPPNPPDILKLPVFIHNNVSVPPEEFDARDHWPDCETIGRVQDQGACKAAWAIVATEAMSDRYCTLSKSNTTYANISAEDVISCCGTACGFGCDGGYSSAVWHHWVDKGIVTGGTYNTTDGCKPYSARSCVHKLTSDYNDQSRFAPTTALPDCAEESLTPICNLNCEKTYPIAYKEDLHFGESSYVILPNASHIQAEIFNHGPVQAEMKLYGDFFSYKTGVYQHVTGAMIGQHSVKLIGWGTENKVDYWLAVNSWNKEWGEKGLVKILRGKNECGIESNIVAGIPKFG